jgi:hypothetical protein
MTASAFCTDEHFAILAVHFCSTTRLAPACVDFNEMLVITVTSPEQAAAHNVSRF